MLGALKKAASQAGGRGGPPLTFKPPIDYETSRKIEQSVKRKLEDLFSPKKKPDPVPLATPLPSQEKSRETEAEQDDNNCCEAIPFREQWPVGKKNVSLQRDIGWNDWNKVIEGEKIAGWRVICNRGFWFQLEVTESLCDGLEFKCKDNSGIIDGKRQWADGLKVDVCHMIEVKYAMYEKTYTPESASDQSTALRTKLHEQFERYGIICNDPRQVPELPCLKQVGLQVYTNWKTTAGFYLALMDIYSIPGPKPEVRTPREYYKRNLASAPSPTDIEPWMDELSALD